MLTEGNDVSDRYAPEGGSVYNVNKKLGVLRDALFVQKNLDFYLRLHYS